MKKLLIKSAFAGVLLFGITSCHENESYYCYLVEGDPWAWENDTLGTYDEAFWFYKKQSKPQDECKVDRADLIIANQGDPNYSCDCICGWEDD
ncbi:MAG: hypothetical protein ABJG68_09860 [Crocinitomicaceae bacterium]